MEESMHSQAGTCLGLAVSFCLWGKNLPLIAVLHSSRSICQVLHQSIVSRSSFYRSTTSQYEPPMDRPPALVTVDSLPGSVGLSFYHSLAKYAFECHYVVFCMGRL